MHVCSNCRRHVRESECPFCHTVRVATDATPTSTPIVSRDGLRRGALVASVVAMAACGPTVVAAYGIPVDANNGTDTSMQNDDATDAPAADTMSTPDAGDAPLAAYGIPPQDAGEDVNVMPPYGVPPEDAGD